MENSLPENWIEKTVDDYQNRLRDMTLHETVIEHLRIFPERNPAPFQTQDQLIQRLVSHVRKTLEEQQQSD